ncbi:6-phosphogluconate dehydrogenase [Sinomicrobium pectinilyticum]|uniref:6-phosphogluconate dehydrogenase n=1 Tax=Sinomicrobium pectinilyticum TaxID=1084421 RepID=A0A3N0E5N8_SINP1|nr:6-phosphogluconate dehydrogenase [Sinomicrobium pectinilyticum]RNL83146.1 6-phosphogluconate dehydrogenase [Sinomicrobium pectinilyticum]
MKKAAIIILLSVVALFLIYYAFIYFVPYSTGVRSGELIKISHKGVMVKTWEGEISQGISGAQIFSFSVLPKDKKVIEDLKELQGRYVKVDYVERMATFFWLGDTKYFVTNVVEEPSPHQRKF